MADDHFDDTSFKVVRRNLNIISVLILLLAFSNAEINKINFLGIDLELEGEKLYIGLWVLYAYFLWRFCTKLPYRTKFIEAWQQYLFGHADYGGVSFILKDYSQDKLLQSFKAKHGDAFQLDLQDDKKVERLWNRH